MRLLRASMSIMATLPPRRAYSPAMFMSAVVLPAPPLPLMAAITTVIGLSPRKCVSTDTRIHVRVDVDSHRYRNMETWKNTIILKWKNGDMPKYERKVYLIELAGYGKM